MSKLAIVTKSDYQDGHRGFYCRIPEAEKGVTSPDDLTAIKRAINLIFAEALQDSYFIIKIYIRILAGGDYSVNGVGSKYKEGDDNE